MTPEQFMESYQVEGECWVWTRSIKREGYGQVVWNGRGSYAHRVSYELHKGPIPEGLQIDHLCRNRACVNPDHLEAVTQLENVRRGEKATKTHCAQGHELTGWNLIRRKDTGHRQCRACLYVRNNDRYHRRKAERSA